MESTGFDGWLESELGHDLVRASGSPVLPSPRYSSASRRRWIRLPLAGAAGLPLLAGLKTAVAVTAAAVALGGASMIGIRSHLGGGPSGGSPAANASSNGSVVVVQGSPSPTNHGQVVTNAVATCKAARPSPDASPRPSPGSRGIGECVSVVASGGKAGGNGNGKPGSNGTGGGNGNGGAHPTPHAHTTPEAGHPTPRA